MLNTGSKLPTQGKHAATVSRLKSLPNLQVFTEEELASIEAKAHLVDDDARAGYLPDQCFHTSQNRNGTLKRTKFFFGARCKIHFLRLALPSNVSDTEVARATHDEKIASLMTHLYLSIALANQDSARYTWRRLLPSGNWLLRQSCLISIMLRILVCLRFVDA